MTNQDVCGRCGSHIPPGNVQCVGCGCLVPQADDSPGRLRRVLGALARATLFLLAIGAFVAFTLVMTGRVELDDFLDAGDINAAPAAAKPELAATKVKAVEFVVAAGGTEARVVDGGTVTLITPRDHKIDVTVNLRDGRIYLTGPDGATQAVTPGGTVAVPCPTKRMESSSQGGRISIKQVPCDEVITVAVRRVGEPTVAASVRPRGE